MIGNVNKDIEKKLAKHKRIWKLSM